jgi:hypothetical protein
MTSINPDENSIPIRAQILLNKTSLKQNIDLFTQQIKNNSFMITFSNEKLAIEKKIYEYENDFNNKQNKNPNDILNFAIIDKSLKDRLFALSELNIIYNYKEFEINLKKLITIAYPSNDKQFYKWQNLKDFLKSIGLKNTSNAYKQVDQFRALNNHLKHSSAEISVDIKSIPEFVGEKYLTFALLNKFYKRVSFSPFIFIDEIKDAIYDDLFTFNEDRIKELAKAMALRMNKEEAKSYTDEILKLL